MAGNSKETQTLDAASAHCAGGCWKDLTFNCDTVDAFLSLYTRSQIKLGQQPCDLTPSS